MPPKMGSKMLKSSEPCSAWLAALKLPGTVAPRLCSQRATFSLRSSSFGGKTFYGLARLFGELRGSVSAQTISG
jgi:hypothetical protein